MKSQIEPEDLEEGEPAELSELWDDFDTSYNELWTPIEYAEYEWAENIEIIKNPKKSTEDKYNKEKSYVINFYDEQEIPEIIERLYISKDQANLLKLFENGLDLGWQLLSSKEARQVDQVKDFLKSMIEQVVIVCDEDDEDE